MLRKKLLIVSLFLVLSLFIISSCTEPIGRLGRPGPPPSCYPNWKCSNWGECVNDFRERTCWIDNRCDLAINKPVIKISCSSCTPGQCYNQYTRCDTNGYSQPCPSSTPYCYNTPFPNTCDSERKPACSTVGLKECVNGEIRECKFDPNLGTNYWDIKICTGTCYNNECKSLCNDKTKVGQCSTITKSKYCKRKRIQLLL